MSSADGWMCPNCEFMILGKRNKCKKCGAKKPSPSNNKKSNGSNGGSRFNVPSPNAKGTKANKRFERRVRHNRKVGKSYGDEWICFKCNVRNFADREECRNCKNKKSESNAAKLRASKEMKEMREANADNLKMNAFESKNRMKNKAKSRKNNKEKNRQKMQINDE